MSIATEDREVQSVKPLKTMVPANLVLRCVVFQNKAGEYTAECIDLDIMVRRATPPEALRELKQAVSGYLAVVNKGDHAGLVPRPSPFTRRLRYHLYALRAAFSIGIRRKFLVTDWAPDLSSC